LSSGKIAPFPFLILTAIMVFIGIAGIIRDSYSYISSNILLLVSSLLFVAFLVQTILSAMHPLGIYTIVTSIIPLASCII